MDAALERAAAADWLVVARNVIFGLRDKGQPFTADDVRHDAGDPPNPNAMGAVLRSMAHEGWIRHHAYRPSARPDRHGAIVKVWVAA